MDDATRRARAAWIDARPLVEILQFGLPFGVVWGLLQWLVLDEDPAAVPIGVVVGLCVFGPFMTVWNRRQRRRES